MPEVPRHKVFITYYHDDDQGYKDRFAQMMEHNIVDKSVQHEDIDDRQRPTDDILRIIREDYIADATVTVVLIGQRTWQRKYVDWEIGSSLRSTKKNSRCGVLGIILPNHPDHGKPQRNPRLMPPRLADNCEGDDPYVMIYDWPKRRAEARLREWIHRAFIRRKRKPPTNKRKHFSRNRTGNPATGWRD